MFSANTSQVSEDRLYVEDVFSTYLYTGNGSTQTITTGIDLSSKGGMIWQKPRTTDSTVMDHKVFDTARGQNNVIYPNLTSDQNNGRPLSWTSSGFTLDAASQFYGLNQSGVNYASWTFREAPKFFDVVTYTGNGTVVRQINHSLGVTPGFIVVKRTDSTGNWMCVHRNNPMGELVLNSSAANTGNTDNIEVWTSTYIGVSNAANTNGATYVAYLFAHDTTSDGIIQCGSFNTDGSETSVNLGWEPQWVMFKRSSGTGAWLMNDNMRGWPVDGSSSFLEANTSGAEFSQSSRCHPTNIGFKVNNQLLGDYIYIAIRRGPMRTPTLGTSVYKSVTRNGTGSVPWVASGAGFPPDMTIMSGRNLVGFSGPGSYQNSIIDRLRRATEHIQTINTNGEGGGWGSGHIHNMDGYNGLYSGDMSYYNASSGTYVDHHFRRAPSFFDVVCYTGNDVAGRTINHNLSVTPEMIIVKGRIDGSWWVQHSSLGPTKYLVFNTSDASGTASSLWNNTAPTSSVFTIGNLSTINFPGYTYVAYLFASCPGVSKVGTYTGNGSSQTINCGFAAGARFVMIKRTDSTGDWYVWDTARGIVAGNDPRLSLNTSVAEVTTDDSLDTDSSGFVVNQLSATNINVSSATYIYLAVA